MNARVWRIAPFLFGSGLCALVYQTAWQRELRLIFGASTAASAAVLAIFMAGLGLGGALLGPRADKHKRPLELYGNLELLISLSAAATPGLVWLARTLYVALGGTVTLGLAGGSVVRLVLSTLLLAVPTVLMGGTLPAAARAAETPDDVRRRALAVLYGVNTLGAVAGATLSTFFLFEVFGTQQTLWLACLVNALIALGARVVGRSLPEQDVSATPSTEAQPSAPASAGGAPAPRAAVLGAAALVGFAFFLMELVWYRMLGPLLGGSTFTFGIILIVALLGIGLGGAAYSAWGQQRPATLRGFALTCLAEALLIAVPFALGDQVAALSMLLRSLEGFGFMGLVLAWGAVASLVILPAAFVSGVQFPLLLALLGRGREHVGREVGLAYAWNTVGSIIGSLAGGFGLLPLLTAPGTWRLVAGILLALGLAAALLSLRTEKRLPRLALPAALAALTAWLLTAVGPTAAWRHNPIGAGRASVEKPGLNKLRAWAADPRYRLLWEAEGVESSVGLLAYDGVTFYVNGKSDGNSISDASTQVMSGLVGALLHPDPKRSMVIGLGTGSTAGWLGVVPGMEVDVVEIEPAILDVARECAGVNRDVMNNPRVHTFIGDAREVLLASKQRYDIIFSEPSNPYRAGISSLFTRDFYHAARQRMAPGGVFVQWLQAYEIDALTVKSAFATLRSEFGAVEVWQMNAGDLLLVASEAPLPHDYERMRARVAQSPYREALAAAWYTDELEGVLARYLGGDLLVRGIAEGAESLINTDDLSFMEFAVARTVGRRTLSPIPGLRTAAHELRADRPTAARGAVDWERVETWRMMLSLSTHGQLVDLSQATFRSRDALQRKAVFDLHQRRDSAQAVRVWREMGWQPRGMQELGLVSRALAEQGDEAAVPFVEQLRASGPLEAEVVLGRLRLKQGRHSEAADAFERAFAQLRREPWGQRSYLELMLASVMELSGREPALARRLYAAAEKPFSSHAIEIQRRQLRLELASVVDWRGLCVEALKPFEPHPTWTRDFLTQRAECYHATGHASAPQALADLALFVSDEPTPVWESTGAAPESPAEGAPGHEKTGAPPVAGDALSQ